MGRLDKKFTGKHNTNFGKLDIKNKDALNQMFNEPSHTVKRPTITIGQYERKLKWFFDIIEKGKRYGRTSNALVAGRFYTFKYVAKNQAELPLWDRRPVILCLNSNFTLRYGSNMGAIKGFIGVNFHYYPVKDRTKLLKDLILNDPTNHKKFSQNKNLNVKGKMFDKDRGLQQYHFARRFDEGPAGAFEIEQIPYNFIHDILDFPSVHEAKWAKKTPF